ncbi:YhgE/Pip domain-containing protein [Paenibacillus sediminis]|uniref:Membrane protein n=1 Tax=Paenibacillus sediminis TaxID=664909 RepID=A0ABS4H4B5_9BACL|nr:YhgE/Pip domain-containing protein [Paenibacillus sediminis]MBP1937365.1 putative membrane protein [Paenibacillus sediminis]
MRPISVFLKDIAAALKNRKSLVQMTGVLFIPVLYAGILLTAFWDPYGKLNELPVAVVNLDKGAIYEGKSLKVGSDLINELKKSDDFNWKFVSQKEAEQGIDSNRYYMIITIPEDFSQKATTLMNDHPEKATIIFEPNEGSNFVASQIGRNAVKEIKAKVSAKVTEAYTETMLDQVDKLSNGLADAGDGATKIDDGAVQVDKGVAKLKENLAKLTNGTVALKEGVTTLNTGTVDVHNGAVKLDQGAASLSSGLQQLVAVSQKLEDGAAQAAQGSSELETGLKSSAAGADQLTSGLKSAEQGSRQLEAGLKQSEQASANLAQGAKSVADGLAALVQSNPDLAKNESVQKLLAASKSVADGSRQLHEGEQQLSQGSTQLHAAHEQLVQGSEQLSEGQQKLLAGASQLNTGQTQLSQGLQQFTGKLSEAATGSKQLASGASQLDAGTEKLHAGVTKLVNGASTIADGSKQLDNGAGQLKDGTSKLTGGSHELATKLNDAAAKASIKSNDSMIDMYAEPVQINEKKHNEVPNYGTGVTPYFLSLGLFVGALLVTIVVPMRETTVQGATAFGRFISRTLTFAGMSIVQSLLACTIILYILGLHVQSVPLFYLFTFITSLTFMMLIQAIVTWLDQPGRFIVILILIFQLSTSAGTFPLELIPDWMKAFHPWLPMAYSVAGYRAVISSGDWSLMWSDVATLAIYGVLGIIFTLLFFIQDSRKAKSSQDQTAVA